MDANAQRIEVRIPDPLSVVMRACEVECLAECCGLDAFDISAECLLGWPHRQKKRLLAEALEQVDALIRATSVEGVYLSHQLNHCGTREEWLAVLSTWRAAIEGAAARCPPARARWWFLRRWRGSGLV